MKNIIVTVVLLCLVFYGSKTLNINHNDNYADISEKIEAMQYLEKELTFIDLEYIGSYPHENFKYFEEYYHNLDYNEFTWYMHLKGDEATEFVNEEFGASIPKLNLDFDKKDIVISFGRELKYLFHDGEQASNLIGGPILFSGEPIFESAYNHKILFIYSIDKIDLVDNEFHGNKLKIYNKDKMIPFDFSYYK